MATATETPGDVPARVARGAAWLDAHEPGWVWRVDPRRLALWSACRCVGGQLVGSFIAFVAKHDLSDGDSVRLGFVLPTDAVGDTWDYTPLTVEWRHAIRARREGGAP